MFNQRLIERIDERLAALSKSERGASLEATGKPDTIRNMKRGNAPRLDAVVNLARVLEVSVDWLIGADADTPVTFRTAKIPAHPGEAIADGNPATVSMEEVDGLLGAGLTTDAANHVVPVGDTGSQYADNVRATWGIPADYLANELKADRARTKIIEVKGDSMEPTLETGDRVMVDPTEQDIASGGIFAIFDGLGMSIRRLEHIPYSEPATVRIIADSPQHGDYERTLEELTIIGRVVWCARRL